MIRLQQLRIDAGLSRQKLAEAAEVSLQTVLNIEDRTSKTPHVATLHKLAAVLGATPSELLMPAVHPVPQPPADPERSAA